MSTHAHPATRKLTWILLALVLACAIAIATAHPVSSDRAWTSPRTSQTAIGSR